MDGRSRRLALPLVAALVWGWSGGAAAADIVTVAKTGDRAPGTPAGVTFLTLSSVPVINGAGEVAFVADLSGPGVTPDNSRGIWAGPLGALKLVARAGDRPSGTPTGVTFATFDSPLINGAGEVAFRANLAGSGVTTANDAGIWVSRGRALALVVREGDRAPGRPPGETFSIVESPLFNGAGEVAFFAFLSASGMPESIWAGGPGSLKLAARSFLKAPGTPRGVTFSGLERRVLNGAGEVAFLAGLSGSGVTNANNSALWVGRPGALKLVTRGGRAAPGTAGARFLFPSSPGVNGAGAVAFFASLTGTGVGPSNDSGIWTGRRGELALVVREGAAAPGTAPGARFNEFRSPVLNGADEVAFQALLAGSGVSPDNDFGLWAGRRGALALVAREGAAAPGTPPGVTFDEDNFGPPLLNGAGELAFKVKLRGAGVTPGVNDEGLWAGRPGRLRLIVRSGDAIEVAPGDIRTVLGSSLRLNARSGDEDGRASGFGEGGQIAFLASFTDFTSGIFLSPGKAPKAHLLSERAIDGPWRKVALPSAFTKPVVIAGPPSFGNKAPGVVRLRKIQGAKARFEARFQEWRYLNGKHPEERIDFLVLEQGRHRQADGSIWEAGTVKVTGNRAWKKQRFKRRFRRPPDVFATVQSFKGRTAVVARVHNVTRTGFEVSIQEEEKDLRGNHPKETLGYLAVDSRKGRGTVAGGVTGSDYRLKQAKRDHHFKKVLGERLKLQEETSKDKETKHKKEAISVMSLGRGLFAQQASDKEVDTTAIRRR